MHLFFYWFFQRFLFHILVKPLKMMINAPSLYRRRYRVFVCLCLCFCGFVFLCGCVFVFVCFFFVCVCVNS